MSKLEIGKQLYLDESPLSTTTKMVSYHIIDIRTIDNEKCLCLLRDTVIEDEMFWYENLEDIGSYPDYDGCLIDSYLNDSKDGFLSRFKPEILKDFIPYDNVITVDLKTKEYKILTRRCYIPSAYELFGITRRRKTVDGEMVFYGNAYNRNISKPYWTRTPSSNKTAVFANEIGIESNRVVISECGVRPILWIKSIYFEGNYVEDDTGVSFDIMYSINIEDSKDIQDTELDTSIYKNEYLNNSVQETVGFSVSRFTPLELRGFAKTGKSLIYDNHILTVDYEMCSKDMFYSFYINNRESTIYGISVDSNRIICEYVYRYLETDLSLSVDDSNISKYTPEQLADFYDKGMQLKYFNDNLQLIKYNKGNNTRTRSRAGTVSSVDFLEFSSQDSKVYKVSVDSNGSIKRETYKNLVCSYELCDTGGNKYECRYDTEFLFNACNDDYTQITYNGNILYVDKLSTTLTEFNGYYFDEYDTAIYKINVKLTNDYYKISRNLHKRIIKTVEIDGSDLGITEYTITGIIDRSDYYISNIEDLYIEYPSEHFDLWVTVTAGSSDCNIHFPNGTVFIKNQEFNSIPSSRTREISIKNGAVVSMPHGEEWMEFDD